MLAKTSALLNRELLARELRSGKHKQTFFDIGDWRSYPVRGCFQAVAFNLIGSAAYRADLFKAGPWWRLHFALSPQDVNKLIAYNDANTSFPDLATKLEECPFDV